MSAPSISTWMVAAYALALVGVAWAQNGYKALMLHIRISVAKY